MVDGGWWVDGRDARASTDLGRSSTGSAPLRSTLAEFVEEEEQGAEQLEATAHW